MKGYESRRVSETDLRAREGAICVSQELPKWLFVARLEALEVDDWGIKATVLPLPFDGLPCPAQSFVAAGAWIILFLSDTRWSARYGGWSMLFGEEIVAQLKSQATELAHVPLPKRNLVLVRLRNHRE
jgi:hypothetical protein